MTDTLFSMEDSVLEEDLKVNRKEWEREARKKDIIDVAAKLFSEKDFHEVKVDEIAERVGLSKGTLYLYFENKENLFLSIIWERMKSLMDRIKKTVTDDKPYIDRLRCFIHTYLSFFVDHQAFFKIIESEKVRMSTDEHYKLHRYGKQVFVDFFKVVVEIVRVGQEEGVLRAGNSENGARFLVGMLNSFTFQRVIFDISSDLDEDVDFLVDAFLNGIGSKESR